jgi:hypothetical protein
MWRRLIYLLFCFALPLAVASAGQIIVQKSSDENKVDIFALKQELLQQQIWQQRLRDQAQLRWLSTLPLGCIFSPQGDYHCGLTWYRPYRYQQQQLYIEIPPQ